jgi:hypothetical protein
MSGFADRSEGDDAIEQGTSEQEDATPQVHFIGQPILPLNPALNNDLVPLARASHELIRGEFFYTFPRPLLEAVLETLDRTAFDDELLDMEFELSDICGDHESQVGFWNRWPVSYNLLRQSSPRMLSEEQIAWGQAHGWDLSREQIENSLRIAFGRTSRFEEVARGYAGWLMTNPQFLDEHDSLMNEHGEQARRWGTHLVGVPIPEHMSPGAFNPTTEEGWPDYESAVIGFLVRWRLRALAGPVLPVPMQPLMSGDFPIGILQQLMRAGGVFNWPDICPVPSRDELRGILEDALRRNRSADHVAEWMEIVHRSNQAKNRILRLGRLFEVQHFWRLLHLRHTGALEGNVKRIEIVFADYYGLSDEAIHADLIEIRRRLSQDWISRGILARPPRHPR